MGGAQACARVVAPPGFHCPAPEPTLVVDALAEYLGNVSVLLHDAALPLMNGWAVNEGFRRPVVMTIAGLLIDMAGLVGHDLPNGADVLFVIRVAVVAPGARPVVVVEEILRLAKQPGSRYVLEALSAAAKDE